MDLMDKISKEYYGIIYKYYSIKLYPNTSHVEDLTNDTFLALVERYIEAPDKSEGEYIKILFGIAKNIMKVHYRAMKKVPDSLDDPDSTAHKQFQLMTSDLNQYLYEEERYQELVLEFRKLLKPKEQILYDYVIVQNLPMKEISELLHISEDAVGKRMYRIRAKLSTYKSKYGL